MHSLFSHCTFGCGWHLVVAFLALAQFANVSEGMGAGVVWLKGSH